MAVNGTMDAPRRRLVFGVNVFVQALLAIVVVVALLWIAGRFNVQADLTGSGRNSLSSRTVNLLKGLKEDVRITAVFAEPDKRDEIGQKRRRAMRDLLDLYEQAGGARVTTQMIDPSLEKAATDRMLQHLLELPAYKDEARPHQEALTKSAELTEKIKALVDSDAKQLDTLVGGDAQLARNRNLAIIRMNLQQTARDAQDTQEKIQDLTHGEIPRFGQAVKALRDYVKNAELLLRDAAAWMTGDGLSSPGITPDLRTFFQDANTRYEPLLAEMRTLQEQTENLKDVKVEELYNNLTRWRQGPPVLVENTREARVIPFWDLWTAPSDPGAPVGPDGDDRVFAGESAISSAVLQLTQTEKTAVVFTRFGGEPLLRPDFSRMNPMMMQQMPRAPYQECNALLEKANFVTQEWDVATQKTPPVVENAARTIYVVLPPEPPPQQDPRRPSPEGTMTPADRKIVLDAVEASGLAIFLTGWMPPPSPMPGAVGAYEYADYLKSTWGIDVLYGGLTLRFVQHPDKKGEWVPAGRQPQLLSTDDVVRLSDHQISAPLKADRAAFVLAAPLRLTPADSRPAGLTLDVLAEVRKTVDVWACADLNSIEEQLKRKQGVQPGPGDVPTPFPIAVAASRAPAAPSSAPTSQPAVQRVVVFSSEHFASDALAQASGLQQRGNALIVGPLYPANSDLFINALHWLAGDADRIAVGPRSGELPRLKDLDEAWAARLPWLLVGVWPGVALLVGLGVWLIRRR
ncbi:MAG TPA: Gldg family protein [Phycisphaerae bacterium]|nr:Gldg family protein [Phycisphaerae bacterium]HPM22259.1 Gldg family protein [Phycisphaerae bacterium]HQL53755.1 Gldg family protein [Phycisphaerae bacterium]